MISAQVLNLYKRLGGLGITIKPTLHPGDVLIFNKCLVHRLKPMTVKVKIWIDEQELNFLHQAKQPPPTSQKNKRISRFKLV